MEMCRLLFSNIVLTTKRQRWNAREGRDTIAIAIKLIQDAG